MHVDNDRIGIRMALSWLRPAVTRNRALLQMLTATLFLAAAVQAQENYANWRDSTRIYLNTAGVEGFERNFPVLIRLNPSTFSGFAQTRPGGADIRFAKPNGAHLSYQIERWIDRVNNNDTAEIWVKIDTVWGGGIFSNRYITMYWNNPTVADSSRPTAVFDTANGFMGVWHLNTPGTGSRPDATHNLFNAGVHNAVFANGGAIAGCDTFVAANDAYDSIAGGINLANKSFTVMAWFKLAETSPSSYQFILGQGGVTSDSGLHFGYRYDTQYPQSSRKMTFAFFSDDIDQASVYSGGTDWHLLVGTYNIADRRQTLYYDGALDNQRTANGNYKGRGVLRIGKRFTADNFNGKIDEVRIEDTVRSPGWIRLCYENQRSNQTLLCYPPVITRHPSNDTVDPGQQMSFSVTAAGSPITYAWQKSSDGGSTWGPASGTATASTYQYPAATADTGTRYRCIVSSGFSSVFRPDTSDPATLTVRIQTEITSEPGDAQGDAGVAWPFSVTARGYALSYLWQRSDASGPWTAISGATSSVFNYTIKTTDTSARFRCVVTGVCDSRDTSRAAVLTLCYDVTITQHPRDTEVAAGRDASFSVVATSPKGIDYQWWRCDYGSSTWSIVSTATSATYTITTTAADSGSRFRCVLSPLPCGDPVISSEAMLHVWSPPVITTEPHDTNAVVADTAAFIIAATGTAITYRWQRTNDAGSNWNSITGATGIVYKFRTQASDTGGQVRFRCVVGGKYGSADTSVSVRVGIGFPAVIVEEPADIEVIPGQQAQFRVRATGSGLGYRWDRWNTATSVWNPVASATGESYAYTPLSAADSGARFRCRVIGTYGSDTSRAAVLSVWTLVAITSQPADDTIPGNGTTDFSVGVSGTRPSLQWERSRNGGTAWTVLTGVTSFRCRVPVDTADTAALYRCVVTGKYNVVTSGAARLTLTYPVAILQHPANVVDIVPGQQAAFSVTASGVQLRYRWETCYDGINWNAVAGAVSPRYGFIVQEIHHGSRYRCRISAPCKDTVSDAATLTVCLPVSITSEPADQAVIEGRTARFTVSATGTSPGYRWERRTGNVWDTVSGAIDTSYAIQTKLADNGAQFRCVVSGKNGRDTSREATLTVYAVARARFSMSDSIGPAPLTVTFTDSSGGAIGRWRWRYGDGAIDTGTTPAIQVHRYDSAGVFPVTLFVDGAGGVDSMSRRVVVYSKEGNPILLTGRYPGSDSVELAFRNYDSLRTSAPSPYVTGIRLWRRRGALPADTAGSTVQKVYDLAAMKAQGSDYRDRVAVPPLPLPDSVYGFMTQIVWNDNRITPFAAQNGCTVLMRDTVKPANRLVLSASYTPWDTVTFFIDSVGAIDTPGTDSVGVWYGLGNDTVPDFGNKTGAVKWWSAGEVLSGAPAGRFIYRLAREEFNTDRTKLTCAVVLVGKNHQHSAVATGGTTIGRVRPENPIVLHAKAVTAGSIRLSWNGLAPSAGVERIRIYYRSGDTLLLVHDFTGMVLDSLVPKPSDSEATAFRLHEKTRYYFGAQIYKEGLWSRLTGVSRASDSTPEKSVSTITNTIAVNPVVFDTVTNELRIGWRLDTLVGSKLEIGISYSYMSGGTPSDTGIKKTVRVTAAADSAVLPLGSSLLFDRDVYVYLWLKKEGEQWVAPTPASTGMTHIPPFNWQAVHYAFDFDGDTTFWANGTIGFITPPVSPAEKAAYSGTIAAFTPGNQKYEGFVVVGRSFVFTKNDPSMPFTISLGCDSIPQGKTLRDVRIYRFDGKYWLVESGTGHDTAAVRVFIRTDKLDKPFAAMIDTMPPVITVKSQTAEVLGKLTRVFDTLDVTDNAGNPAWRFRCARGGDSFALGDTSQGQTLSGGAGRVCVTIKDSLVTDENGVRAWFVVDDGRLLSRADLSRRVIRDRSDAIVTPEMKWMPLRVTAEPDSPSAKRLLRFVDTAAKESRYDKRLMRLFRWHPGLSDASGANKWLEYNPESDSAFTFTGGRLFWIKTRNSVRLDFGRAVTLSLRDTVMVALNPAGWTDFAVPFRFNVRIGDVIAATRECSKLADSLQFYQWARDSAGNYHCTHFYITAMQGFDSLARVMSCRDLAGFTVYNPNKESMQLLIPPISESESSFGGFLKRETSGGWTVRVSSKDGNGVEYAPVHCGYVARHAGGASYYPLPPRFDGMEIGVVEERTGSTWGSVTLHETNESGCAYLLSLCNEEANGTTVRLRLDRAGNFTPELKTALYDVANESTAEVGDGQEYPVAVEGKGREFRWLFVGNAEYVASAAHRWPGGKLALENIFPNPLRGYAHFRYRLPFGKVSRVEFTVFDIRGRVIWRQSVPERSVFGGVRDYRWYGTNAAGRRVAAGVYIVKMTGYDLKHRVLGAFERRITVLGD